MDGETSVGAPPGLREWITSRVAKLEGFEDLVLVDFILRSYQHSKDTITPDSLEANLAVLLEPDKARKLALDIFAHLQLGQEQAGEEGARDRQISKSNSNHDDVMPSPSRVFMSGWRASAPSLATAGSGMENKGQRSLSRTPPPSTSLKMSLRGAAVCAPQRGISTEDTTPTSSMVMAQDEVSPLNSWLSVAARQIYGKCGAPRHVMVGAANILSNRQLSMTVFRSIEALHAEQVPSKALNVPGLSFTHDDIKKLPAAQRAMLDDEMLRILDRLWSALKEDDLDRARSLLLETSGEVLSTQVQVKPPSPESPEFSHVQQWVEERIIREQGFFDEVVVDSICRHLRDPDVNYDALQNSLSLLIDGDSAKFVKDLVRKIALVQSTCRPVVHGLVQSSNGNGVVGKGVVVDPKAHIPQKPLLLQQVAQGLIIVSRDATGLGAIWMRRRGAPNISPVESSVPLSPLRAAWPAPDAVLLHVGDALVLVRASGTASRITCLPSNTCSVDTTWPSDGELSIVAIADECVSSDETSGQPRIWPRSKPQRRLHHFTSSHGWRDQFEVAKGSRDVTVAQGGLHCGWCVTVDDGFYEVSSSSAQGEFYLCELRPGATPRRATQGARWCGRAAIR